MNIYCAVACVTPMHCQSVSEAKQNRTRAPDQSASGRDWPVGWLRMPLRCGIRRAARGLLLGIERFGSVETGSKLLSGPEKRDSFSRHWNLCTRAWISSHSRRAEFSTEHTKATQLHPIVTLHGKCDLRLNLRFVRYLAGTGAGFLQRFAQPILI